MSEHERDPVDPRRRAVDRTMALGGAAAAAGAGTAARAQDAPAARRFEGARVLITGATSGVGRATAAAFAREGRASPFAAGARTSAPKPCA